MTLKKKLEIQESPLDWWVEDRRQILLKTSQKVILLKTLLIAFPRWLIDFFQQVLIKAETVSKNK